MCHYYTVSWLDTEGAEIPGSSSFEFSTPDDEAVLPACTCWLGLDNLEGNMVWEAFCAKLRTLISEPYVGKIVIEVD